MYNPLKLPLGWDGKPIPYWLYKLHGLNLEFKCEICGARMRACVGRAGCARQRRRVRLGMGLCSHSRMR